MYSIKNNKGKRIWKELKQNYALLLMLLPGFVALALFAYKPIYGLLIVFKDYKFRLGVWGSPWADKYGMEHFFKLFGGSDFPRVLKNSITISLMKLLFGFPAPIILALMLNELHSKFFKRTVQTLTYLPYFFSWVVLGGIFKMLFSAVGPVNMILSQIGVKEPILFFGSNTPFLILIIISSIWQSVGWSAVIYMAALSGVDESLYEAAYIDGVTLWKRIWNIDIPAIMGTVTTVFIMNLGSVLEAGFDQIYNMYNAMVYSSADILDTYSLRLLQGGRYEIGTALGIFKSLVGLIFILAANKLIKKISDNEYGII